MAGIDLRGASSGSAASVPARVPAVVGDGATDDAAVIQAQLTAAGGLVVVPAGASGVVTIASTLTIPSGTTLRLGAGVTLRRKVGFLGSMIANAGATANRTVADAAITSGTTTLTSATAAFTSADVGRTVTVAGALAANTPLTTTIASVTNGTTAVLNLAAAATVSGASLSIYQRDSNITLEGDIGSTIDSGDNSAAPTGQGTHHIRLQHIDGCRVRGLKIASTGGKYAIDAHDVTDFDCDSVTYATTSDGCHITGPSARVRISNQHGTTGDDMVALTANDYTNYNTVGAGDITDVEIHGVFANGSREGVKVLAGAGTTVKRVRVRGVYGSTVQNPVYVGDDSAQATTTGGTIDSTFIEAVYAAPGNGYHPVVIFASVGKRITCRDIVYDNTTNGAGGIVEVESTANVTNLNVENVNLVNTGTGTSAVKVIGTVTDLTIRGVQGTLGASSSILQLNAATSVVTRATISDCHTSGGSAIVQTGNAAATLPNVEVSNCSTTGAAWLLDMAGTTEAKFASTTAKGLAAGLVNIGASGSVRLRGAVTASTGIVNITAGGHAQSSTFDLAVDVSKLDKNLGDYANNSSNANTGTLGLGPCVCTGTGTPGWKNLATGNTF